MKHTRKLIFYITLLCTMIIAGHVGVFGSSSRGIVATVLMIIGGLSVLILGGDHLVEGANSIAAYYDIPPLIVGMTILAMGTSMPELFVNIIAAFRGETGLLLANVVGSNISNLLLIGGVTALVAPLIMKRSTQFKEIPISFFAALILLCMIVGDSWFGAGGGSATISRIDALLLLVCFGLFLYQLFYAAKNHEIEIDDALATYSLPVAFVIVLLGVAGLYVGGEALVTHATSLALIFNVSTVLIGASIVAIGTSVPELVTSVIAALKKQTDMAIGNIIGSNIFNIFWIIGIIGLIKPIVVDTIIITDIIILMSVTTLLFLLVLFKKEKKITRYEGIIFVLLYFCYMGFLIMRG